MVEGSCPELPRDRIAAQEEVRPLEIERSSVNRTTAWQKSGVADGSDQRITGLRERLVHLDPHLP